MRAGYSGVIPEKRQDMFCQLRKWKLESRAGYVTATQLFVSRRRVSYC